MSAYAVAKELGTTVPRVVRAARRLGVGTRTSRGHLAFTAEEVAHLRDVLGVAVSLPGFSQSEVAVLAALARAPLGLPSLRAVAARAGLSPTAASRAVASLARHGLVHERRERIAAGRAREVHMLYANRKHPDYDTLAPRLRRVVPPRPQPEFRAPARLGHLFWNTNPAQLDVAHGGPYIARRLLRTCSPEGLAWGARNLSAEHWLAASQARGLNPAAKALAHNIAAASRR